MSITAVKSVNFGSRKTGLGTVGYTLYDPNGTLKQARTTTGVTELVASTGIYKCQMSLGDDWKGFILWDTGEATPLYAVEDFNFQSYSIIPTPYDVGS